MKENGTLKIQPFLDRLFVYYLLVYTVHRKRSTYDYLDKHYIDVAMLYTNRVISASIYLPIFANSLLLVECLNVDWIFLSLSSPLYFLTYVAIKKTEAYYRKSKFIFMRNADSRAFSVFKKITIFSAYIIWGTFWISLAPLIVFLNN